MRLLIALLTITLAGCIEPKPSDLSYADLIPYTDHNGKVTFTFIVTDKYMDQNGGREAALANAIPYYINFRKICPNGYRITSNQKLPSKPHHEYFGECK